MGGVFASDLAFLLFRAAVALPPRPARRFLLCLLGPDTKRASQLFYSFFNIFLGGHVFLAAGCKLARTSLGYNSSYDSSICNCRSNEKVVAVLEQTRVIVFVVGGISCYNDDYAQDNHLKNENNSNIDDDDYGGVIFLFSLISFYYAS